MKKILVTGGLGYIGSHTAVTLVEKGYEVIILDNYSNSDPQVLQKLRKILGDKENRISFYNLDVCDKDKLQQIFEENDIYGVIHFAGYKAVAESVAKPLKYYHNNLFSTIILLELMEKYKVYNFVFSSSATVYGVPKKMPLDEKMSTGATNPYGRTKLWSESIFNDLCTSNSNWKIISLRYFNPIGAHKSGEIGENPQGIPNNLVPFLTQVAVGERPKLYIYGRDYNTPDGTCIRDYIHILDLAQGHVDALEYLGSKDSGHSIINLGSGKGYSVLEIIKSFENILGSELPKENADRRKGDIPISYADITKAKEILNWEPKYSLEEMCRDSWNWQQKYPKGYNK